MLLWGLSYATGNLLVSCKLACMFYVTNNQQFLVTILYF